MSQSRAADYYVADTSNKSEIVDTYLESNAMTTNSLLEEEYYLLTNQHRRMLEEKHTSIEERKEWRRKRRDKKRADEEALRLYEKRNNPANLAACATAIQKFIRMRPIRKKYLKLLSFQGEQPKKKAIIIVIDKYDDKRVRTPPMLCEDGFDLAKYLQAFNFSIDFYCYASGVARYAPTRSNIVRAIDEAANADPDTLVWVHICGCGGTGTVNGRNPHKEAQKEELQRQTPRTRLLRALQSSHTGHSSGATVGDLCHYIFPSDAKSARLTFDNVIIYEKLMSVLTPREGEQIYNRPLFQRIITVDVMPFGWVEGQQGGGFAAVASSATHQFLYEMPPASIGEVVEPVRGVLGFALKQSLLGGFLQQEDMNDGMCPVLSAAAMVQHIQHTFSSVGISANRKGSAWGDIPIISSEKRETGLAFLERAYAATTINEDCRESKGPTKQRKKVPPSLLRTACFTVTVRVNLSDPETRMDVYSTEFVAILLQYLHVFAQQDPFLPLHRFQKLQLGRCEPRHVLCLGLNGTFVDVASKAKGKGDIKGNDVSLWDDVIEALTGVTSKSCAYSLWAGKPEEGGVVLGIDVHSWDVVETILANVAKVHELVGIEWSYQGDPFVTRYIWERSQFRAAVSFVEGTGRFVQKLVGQHFRTCSDGSDSHIVLFKPDPKKPALDRAICITTNRADHRRTTKNPKVE